MVAVGVIDWDDVSVDVVDIGLDDICIDEVCIAMVDSGWVVNIVFVEASVAWVDLDDIGVYEAWLAVWYLDVGEVRVAVGDIEECIDGDCVAVIDIDEYEEVCIDEEWVTVIGIEGDGLLVTVCDKDLDEECIDGVGDVLVDISVDVVWVTLGDSDVDKVWVGVVCVIVDDTGLVELWIDVCDNGVVTLCVDAVCAVVVNVGVDDAWTDGADWTADVDVVGTSNAVVDVVGVCFEDITRILVSAIVLVGDVAVAISENVMLAVVAGGDVVCWAVSEYIKQRVVWDRAM